MHLAIRTDARLRIITVGAGVDADAAAARLSEAVRIEVLRMEGDPGPCLVTASAEDDLLVCGSHGRGRVFGALLGSVSAHLLATARSPLMIIPPRVRSQATGPLGLTTAAGWSLSSA
jgi:nucleotide-binding universal stress UspA family protein